MLLKWYHFQREVGIKESHMPICWRWWPRTCLWKWYIFPYYEKLSCITLKSFNLDSPYGTLTVVKLSQDEFDKLGCKRGRCWCLYNGIPRTLSESDWADLTWNWTFWHEVDLSDWTGWLGYWTGWLGYWTGWRVVNWINHDCDYYYIFDLRANFSHVFVENLTIFK